MGVDGNGGILRGPWTEQQLMMMLSEQKGEEQMSLEGRYGEREPYSNWRTSI